MEFFMADEYKSNTPNQQEEIDPWTGKPVSELGFANATRNSVQQNQEPYSLTNQDIQKIIDAKTVIGTKDRRIANKVSPEVLQVAAKIGAMKAAGFPRDEIEQETKALINNEASQNPSRVGRALKHSVLGKLFGGTVAGIAGDNVVGTIASNAGKAGLLTGWVSASNDKINPIKQAIIEAAIAKGESKTKAAIARGESIIIDGEEVVAKAAQQDKPVAKEQQQATTYSISNTPTEKTREEIEDILARIAALSNPEEKLTLIRENFAPQKSNNNIVEMSAESKNILGGKPAALMAADETTKEVMQEQLEMMKSHTNKELKLELLKDANGKEYYAIIGISGQDASAVAKYHAENLARQPQAPEVSTFTPTTKIKEQLSEVNLTTGGEVVLKMGSQEPEEKIIIALHTPTSGAALQSNIQAR